MSLRTRIIHLIFLTFSVVTSFSSYPDEISGAACIIRFNDKMVFTQEIVTNKISIPAGGLLDGEKPKNTARRETYEETGLLVKPMRELGRSKTTVFFDCVPAGKVQALKPKNRYQGNNLRTWKAPHYGVEVNLAMIADPSTIVGSEYRLPQQLPWLEKMFSRATNNEIVYVPSFNTDRSLVEDIQVNFLNQLEQSYFSLSQSSQYTVQILLVVTKLLNSPILIFLILVWACRIDYQVGLKLLIFTVTINMLALLLQRSLNYPSPNIFASYYITDTKTWFSLPSIALVNWSFFCLLARDFFKEKIRCVSWLALSFLSLNMSLVVLEGSVFLADGLVSIFIGFVVYLGFKKWLGIDSTYLKEHARLCLAVLLVSCFILTLFWPLITLFSLMIILATLILVSYSGSGRLFGAWMNKRFYTTFFAVMSVDFLLTIIFHFFVSEGKAMVALEMLRYPVAILFLYRQSMFVDKGKHGDRTSGSEVLSNHYEESYYSNK
ncbi:NUDIX hydrolase [Vibrio caribbeanicus]|uniref:NUDIX hydrolase n=1 Tax=Vibrio caribbeanicus TaxID=701175 RepID=UPI0022851BA0|nr:NUDIX hydrolase [Vibrio caribbeanicus]MCY9845555.1 NUDIX hydrolase [Vibrio caribbeanicus]